MGAALCKSRPKRKENPHLALTWAPLLVNNARQEDQR